MAHLTIRRALIALSLVTLTLAAAAPLSGCRQIVKSAARAGASSAKKSASGDSVASFEKNDPEMNAAIGRAQRSVDTVIQRIKSPRRGDTISIKVPVKDRSNTEHFWMDNVTFDGTQFHGTLANEPMVVRNVHMGDGWYCPKTEISDWMIVGSDRILIGGETIRVMRDKMSASERAKFDRESGFKVN